MRINIRIEIASDNGDQKSNIETMYVIGPIPDYYIEKGSVIGLLNEALNAAYMNYRANTVDNREFRAETKQALVVKRVEKEIEKEVAKSESDKEKIIEDKDYNGHLQKWIRLDKFAEIEGYKSKQTFFNKMKKEKLNDLTIGLLEYDGKEYNCQKRGREWWIVYEKQEVT